MQLDNALNLTVRQVGHRDIIAIQKGKTFIVILKVKRFPHTRGQLVNKTEHAMVSTTVLFITKVCFEIAAERLIFPFFNRNLLLCTILADRQSEMRRRGIELIVQCIVQGVTINGQQRTARFQAQTLCGGMFINTDKMQRHSGSSFPAE